MGLKSYSLEERASLYKKAFPKWPASFLTVSPNGRWLSGIWLLGNNYKNKSLLYGAYPPNYLDRILGLFPDATNIIHLFSGSLPKGQYIRVDINPKLKPDILARVEELPLVSNSFDLVLADPPYSKLDAIRYGYPLPNKRKCIKEAARLLKSGGFLVWLDTILPMYSKEELSLVGLIGIIRSTNHRVRLVSIFKRPHDRKDNFQ